MRPSGQAANQTKVADRQRLRDDAAERETEDVHLGETKRLDERRRVGRHLFDRGWHLAARAGNARVVEQDHLPRRREAVGHQRVPVVHRAGEIHVEDEWHATRFAEASVSEPNASRIRELRRRGLVTVLGHSDSLWRWRSSDMRSVRKRAANLRARTGSVRAVTAVDVEDVTRDQRGLVGRDEDDTVGDRLGEAETIQRNLRYESRLVLRRAGEAGQHSGVRWAWRDGIHTDFRLGDIERHRLGDAFDGVLAADIDGGPRRTFVPVGRGDVDNAASAEPIW